MFLSPGRDEWGCVASSRNCGLRPHLPHGRHNPSEMRFVHLSGPDVERLLDADGL
jgi:hypothetical protein